MYRFLENNLPIMADHLQNKFQASIEKKTFKNTEDPYILINLPIEKQNLTINYKKMLTLEQHFTVPKKVNQNSKSIYHYTLVLQELDTQKEYKTHLFFDNLDRITIEPKLFSDNERFISIDNNSMKKISAYSLSSTKIISSIRDEQKKAIMPLIERIDATEIELTCLSEDITKNKDAYIEKINFQVESLRSLESMGVTLRKNEIRFYQKLLQTLDETSIDKTQAIEKNVKSNLLEDNPLNEVSLLPREKSIAKAFNTPQKRARRNKKSNAPSNLNLITACKQSIVTFDESVNPDPAVIEKMIHQIVELRSIDLLSSNPGSELLEIKVALRTKIGDYLKKDLLSKYYLYLLAVNAQIMPLSDEFLLEVIKTDSDNILKMVLQFKLIANSTKIHLSGDNNNFTLLEWSVHFDASKCFNYLIENEFSMDFINEENSPFVEILDNPSKHLRFAARLHNDATVKLNYRILPMLEKRAQSTSEDVRLIKLKIEQIKVVKDVINFCHKDKKYRLLFNYEFKSGLNIEIVNAMNHSVEFQESILRNFKATYAALESLPLQFHLMMRKENEKLSMETRQARVREFNAMPTDLAIKKLVNALDVSTEVVNAQCNAFNLKMVVQNPTKVNKRNTTAADSNHNPNILTAFNTLKISDNDNTSTPAQEKQSKKMNYS